MKLFQVLLISSVMMGLLACKSNKNTAAKTVEANSSEQPTPSTTYNTTSSSQTVPVKVAPDKIKGDSIPGVYRVAVSFISFGAGTDPEGRAMLDRYVQQYMDASSKIIIYDAHPWGREGEIDICFTLNNLSPEEQINFVNGVREAFKGHELVHILENKQNNYRR